MLTAIDLFAGAGGFSEGFRMEGFHILAANDLDKNAADTYKQNHPEVQFLDGPIQDIDGQDLLKVTGIKKEELDVLIGGPPCQAFSVYNHQRGFHDERSGLFREYIRIVEALKPKIIVMENVTGMSSVEKGRAIIEIHKALEQLGYTAEHKILKAEDYGVPQERRRIIFFGVRDNFSIQWPEPTHDKDGYKKLKKFNTVWDAISDLPALNIDEGFEEGEHINEPLSDLQKYLRKRIRHIFNHYAPHLAPINIQRMRFIPQGGSWRDIPQDLLPNGMKRANRSDHTKRYGRLMQNGLSSTILTRCDPHWGAYIHPTQDRTLTVREAARLQTFPDRIKFSGSRVEQYRQVGNAVPPLLGKAIAKSVRNILTIGNLK
ncbi:MAG: DNA cytosine methyltransferase [Treponema sp.]|jgi:DNA (cytosine-5)-methyltransferase 1|nr:DNA cytosine methyltransferase [Treponema sp.]